MVAPVARCMGEFRAERGWTGLVHVSDVRARYDAPPDPEVGRAGVEVKVEGNAGRANLDRDDILQTVGLLAWAHTGSIIDTHSVIGGG